MAVVEDVRLPEKYGLVKLNVASGTQLATRAAHVVEHLSKDEPAVVSLSTPSRNANKLISVVEIAKRELKANNVSVFQYNALSSETVQVERKETDATKPMDGERANAADDSDDAFETMGGKITAGPKMRLIPVMTVYLSTESIRELKTTYR